MPASTENLESVNTYRYSSSKGKAGDNKSQIAYRRTGSCSFLLSLPLRGFDLRYLLGGKGLVGLVGACLPGRGWQQRLLVVVAVLLNFLAAPVSHTQTVAYFFFCA